MSIKSDDLLTHMLSDVKQVTSAPAANNTCTGSIAAPANGKLHINCITGSCVNRAAAMVTATLTIRDASIAGTALASWDFVMGTVAAPECAVVFEFKPELLGLKGSPVVFDFGTPNANMVQKVTMTGWGDD